MVSSPNKDKATEKSSGATTPQMSQMRTLWYRKSTVLGTGEMSSKLHSRKVKKWAKPLLRTEPFLCLADVTTGKNQDPAGVNCRDMKSVGRHKGESSLPEIKLLAASSQLREPSAPWGATKVKLWLGSHPLVLWVKFKCLHALKLLQRGRKEECHDCCRIWAAESHKHCQWMP